MRDRSRGDDPLMLLSGGALVVDCRADVRQPSEWQAGHVPGAHHSSGGELPTQLGEVPGDKPVAVYCGSGYRSSVAASLLRRNGHREVYNVIGGFTAWEAEKLPVEGR